MGKIKEYSLSFVSWLSLFWCLSLSSFFTHGNLDRPGILQAQEKQEERVVVTRTVEKYHRESCVSLRGTEGTKLVSVEEAKKSGLEPCKICKP